MIKSLFQMGLNWLTGSTLDRILQSVDNTVDNETDRQKIRADAVTSYVKEVAELKAQAMQTRVFWWIWALFAAPLGLWWAAINFDSIFHFSWNVADLPPSVKPYADQIFTAVFGSGAAVSSIQAISGAIRGRK
jgi:hypothetical protein